MKLHLISIQKPEPINFIIGQSHFIKTVEDIHEMIVATVPGAQFGLAFCEASGPRLIRTTGTDEEMVKLATENAQAVGAGHSFFIFLKAMFPINILNPLKQLPEVCRIYCATANPTQVVVSESVQGRGILGVIDGGSPLGVETEIDKQERREFLRKIGYKF